MPFETVFRGVSAILLRSLVVGLVAVSGFVPAAWGWGNTGHLVVAQIAYDRLTPSTRAEADRLIRVLAGSDPRLADFVTASVWMDEVRHSGLKTFDSWHYINLPINAEGLESVAPAKTPNVVWAIDQSARTLASPQATDFDKAFVLRVLLHTVGDIHQPLHTVGRFTAALPNGDRGGNDFLLGVEATPNLHWLWDDTVGLYPKVDPSADWQPVVSRITRELAATIPQPAASEVTWYEGAAADWAREGFRLAQEVVYDGISEGGRPSEEYRNRAHGEIARRLVLAGNRLAAVLEATLGAGPPAEPLPVVVPEPPSSAAADPSR